MSIDDDQEMKPEYDFSNGVRGKHCESYRRGHRVEIKKDNGVIEEHHFSLEDGAVMLDPDLRAKFPDSESVNRALRALTKS